MSDDMKRSILLPPGRAILLGPLEQKLLEEVWARRNATVRELLADGELRQAYTTIMTTLDRLFKKGLLNRVAEGKAFRYFPRCTREDLPDFVAFSEMRRWIARSQAPTLPMSYFVEAVSARDARLLDELRDLVERKRRELKGEKKL